jgi:hypothetical protein
MPRIYTVGILLLLLCQSSFATLEICIYNNNALYIGSDSLVTQNTNRILTEKVFKIADTCCLTIADNFGSLVRDGKTGRISLCFFPEEIQSIANYSRLSKAPLQNSISNFVVAFGYKYRNWMQTKLQEGGELTTRLTFWSYDKTNGDFFGSSCLFDGTNHVELETVFARGTRHIGPSVWFQGEQHFLPDLILSKKKPLADLRSDELAKNINAALMESPMSEQAIVQCMLEMFRLHKKYAASFSTDKGLIDEPYVIYKITKETVIKIR